MERLKLSLILFITAFIFGCNQQRSTASFGSLGRVVDGDISFSYDGASGTSVLINTGISITPTVLSTVNSTITNCIVKPGTGTLPSGFIVNPLTCQIVGYSVTAFPQTNYSIEVTNSAGKKKTAIVSLRVRGLYSFEGSVSGLPVGRTVTLSHGSGASLVVSANGSYSLPQLYGEDTYNVTAIASHPGEFTCSSQINSGSMSGNITNNITCFGSGSRTLGFSITGLGAGVLTASTNGETLSNITDGSYTFSPMNLNTAYAISVSAITTGYSCIVTNGSGVLSANISNVTIACAPLGPYDINIQVNGITNGSVGFTIGSDVFTNKKNGAYKATGQNYGVNYNLGITPPAFHNCSIVNGSGVIAGITNIQINCVPESHSVGGTITGLQAGETVTIEGIDDGSGTLNRVTLNSTDTSYVMPVLSKYGMTYSLSIMSSSATTKCSFQFTNNQGTISSSDISTVNLICSPRVTGNCNVGSAELWIPNAAVYDAICEDDYLYLAGTFTRVAPRTGSGFSVSTTSPVIPSALDRINGKIQKVIPDGAGGWYVGGTFNTIGTKSISRIAHIRSDLSVDENFVPGSLIGVIVYDLILFGENLYMAGTDGVYTINRNTGVATKIITTNSNVYSLYAKDDFLYFAGSFTTPRSRVAKYNLSTGTLDPLSLIVNDNVFKVVVSSSNEIIIYGDTNYVVGPSALTRYGMAKFSADGLTVGALGATTSACTSGRIGDNFNGLVLEGNNLYTQCGRNIFKWDLPTGGQDTNFSAVSALGTLSFPKFIKDSNYFYIYKSETKQVIRTNLNGAIDNTFVLNNVEGEVLALQGNKLYVGGSFNSAGGIEARGLAKINLSTGKNETAFIPNISGTTVTLRDLHVIGPNLYFGGSFSAVGGVPQYGIGSVSKLDGSRNVGFNSQLPNSASMQLKYDGTNFYNLSSANTLSKVSISGSVSNYGTCKRYSDARHSFDYNSTDIFCFGTDGTYDNLVSFDLLTAEKSSSLTTDSISTAKAIVNDNGKFLVLSTKTNYNGISGNNYSFLFNPDGSQDTNFFSKHAEDVFRYGNYYYFPGSTTVQNATTFAAVSTTANTNAYSFGAFLNMKKYGSNYVFTYTNYPYVFIHPAD